LTSVTYSSPQHFPSFKACGKKPMENNNFAIYSFLFYHKITSSMPKCSTVQ